MARYRFCSFYFAAYDYGKRSIYTAKRPCCYRDSAKHEDPPRDLCRGSAFYVRVHCCALLAKGRAIVLERIACGGGETRWYFCRDKQSFDQIEAALTPGSVVSFYFDERIHPLSASSTADSETEQIIAHDRELVVGVLENDIHIRVDFPCSQAGLQEFRSSVAPTPCCSLGHFPPGKTTASAP
jgi:hypothetical protein